MSCGQTWSVEKMKAPIKIWWDDHIPQLLEATDQNNKVFQLSREWRHWDAAAQLMRLPLLVLSNQTEPLRLLSTKTTYQV